MALKRQGFHWAAAGILAVIAVLVYQGSWRAQAPVADRQFLQFDIDVGPKGFAQPAISRDGTRIVFVSEMALATRRLDQATITRLPGTEGGYLPFFSPDGRWVGFFSGGKLQKIGVEGGAPTVLCDTTGSGGASWGDDDDIIAGLADGLYSIPARGGQPQLLTNSKTERALWPQVLPGGKNVLFAATNGSAQGSLRSFNRMNGKIKTIVENSTHGRYLASGYLVYYQQGTLFVAPMDAGRLELTGPAVPLVFGVSNVGGFGRAEFDISNSGTLVYRGGKAGTRFVMSWLSPSGKTEAAIRTPGNYLTPRLSPDGARVAFSVMEEGRQNLWVSDLRRETFTRLTSGPEPDLLPTWTPDGEFLAFRSGNSLAWMHADGSGKLEYLAGVNRNAGPWSFSGDGKWLAFFPLQQASDLWTVPVERLPGAMRLGQPLPLTQQPGTKGAPAISPDNRWLAYTSSESGHFEIYVMPFSPQGTAANRKWVVSNGGGTCPLWSHNGRELFYQSLDRKIQVAAYRVRGDLFVAEKARAWSDTQLADTGIFPAFDVAPDGKRVVALFSAEDPRSETLVRVLLNLDSELGRRLSARGR
jgi:serine/threonine-protein kinase